MCVLFESRLRELIYPDGSSHSVPWEVVEQAEPGEEMDNVQLWARKTGLLRPDDVMAPVFPMPLAR